MGMTLLSAYHQNKHLKTKAFLNFSHSRRKRVRKAKPDTSVEAWAHCPAVQAPVLATMLVCQGFAVVKVNIMHGIWERAGTGN